ncbi:MAG TPA: hypothetical protein VLD18_03610, partial [Verrucomicrobiae bacterium]|nr:hypothetical protein [Verrucomicrobiae bacterium]
FGDADHGWAVGSDGLMASTSDGGDNWELVSNPVQNPFDPPTPRLTHLPFTAVQFVDADTGWAVGSSGMLLRFGAAPAAAPVLSAGLTEAGGFRLAWPQDGNAWSLVSAGDATAEVWDPVAAEPVDEDGEAWSVELPVEGPMQFFQLLESTSP